MANYKVSINLGGFIDARVMESENDNGDMEKGVFIPFDKNNLHISKRGTITAQLAAFEKKNNFYFGQTHSLVPMWSQAHRDKMYALGIEPSFVGNIAPMKGNCRQYGKDSDKIVTIDNDD